jgi:symplekin
MRKDILDGTALKRAAVDEPVDGLDSAKRQRLGADVPGMPQGASAPPLLPPGPVSYAQLYTLTNDSNMAQLHVRQIPADMAVRTLVHLLKFNISREHLDHAVNTVKGRFITLTSQSQVALPHAAQDMDDDDDDYEPDYQPTEDAEQLKNRLEVDAPEDAKLMKQSQVQESVGPYRLPKAPPMTNEVIDMIAVATIERMFGTLNTLQASQEASEKKRGFYEPVVRGAVDRNAYFRLIVRIAVRPLAGLEKADQYKTAEGHINGEKDIPIADHIRQKLLQYILSDWNRRIGNAVTWFTEEWLTEQAVWKAYEANLDAANGSGGDVKASPPRHYQKWVLRFIDDLSVYLGGSKQDMKILVRFISEIPELDREIVERVAGLASDPERTTIVTAALRYLVQFRPPVKNLCLDALQEVWKADRLSDGPNTALLKKLRPGFIEHALEAGNAKTESVCSTKTLHSTPRHPPSLPS